MLVLTISVMTNPDISTTVLEGMIHGLALLPVSYAQAANDNPWMWAVPVLVVLAPLVGKASSGRRRRRLL